MRPQSFLFPFLLLLFSVAGRAQDTISVFYETAKFKLTEKNRLKLDRFFQSREMAAADSIQIIGVADSSGNIASNYRLSLRRASHVFDYAEKTVFASKNVRILAKGEAWSWHGSMQQHRRVDVIVFFPKPDAAAQNEPDEITEEDGFCYVSADDILIGCRQTVIQKGKRSYIEIEMEPRFYNETVKLYTVGENPGTGKPVLHRVKWKAFTTGESYWRRKRYVATVSKEEFEQLRLVKKSDVPCDSVPCGFRLSDRHVSFNNESSRRIDAFVMENVEGRLKFFNRKKMVLKIPKIYLDTSKPYYLNGNGGEQINWHTKRGKRHRDYYYATIRVDHKKEPTFGIYRTYRGNCYTKNPVYKDDYYRRYCCPLTPAGIPFALGIETGDRNVAPTHFGYAGIYFKYYWRQSEMNILAAIDTKADFLLSMRYDYHFLAFVGGRFHPRTQPYQQRMIPEFYAGTTLNMTFRDLLSVEANQDIHLGIDLTKRYGRYQPIGLERVYLEGGPMLDFSNFGGAVRTQFRLGVQFRIF